jgi:hypothetical protein
MSLAEILAELPKLAPTELELVRERIQKLSPVKSFVASPELLAAIDEGLAVPEDQCIPIEEALRIVRSWNTK